MCDLLLLFLFNVRDLVALKVPPAILVEQAEGYEYSIVFVAVVSGFDT